MESEPNLEDILKEDDNFSDDEFLSELEQQNTQGKSEEQSEEEDTNGSYIDVSSNNNENAQLSQMKEISNNNDEVEDAEDPAELDFIRTLSEGNPTNQSMLGIRSLVKVSEQLSKPRIRSFAGMPTALAVYNLIVVGTSHGHILLFGRSEDIKGVMGTTDFGSVTAVDISSIDNNYWVISGYQNGHIILWDIVTRKPIKTLTNHTLPVLHLKFFVR